MVRPLHRNTAQPQSGAEGGRCQQPGRTERLPHQVTGVRQRQASQDHDGGSRRSPDELTDTTEPDSETEERSFWAKRAQSCPTLCDPTDYTAHGILQARILQWVAFPFSRGSSQPRDQTQVSQHCRRILYQLSHQGSPRILEWVAYPSSRGIFPTQELNQRLLHCRRILYQLNYQ